MSFIKIEIEGLKELQKELQPKKFIMVANYVINEIAKKARTLTLKIIRQKYNISAQRLRKNISIKRSRYSTLEAQIEYKGRTPGLQHYRARQVIVKSNLAYQLYSTKRGGVAAKKLKRPKNIKGVSVEVIKGKRKLIKSAFWYFPKRGGYGIFKRIGKSRLPIRRLYGPSPAGMARSTGAEKSIEEIIAREGKTILARALNRYLRSWR